MSMDDSTIAKDTIKIVIEFARDHLEKLIEKKKENLLDPDILCLSQFLDRLLSEYERLDNQH
jgi:hypothetical protein